MKVGDLVKLTHKASQHYEDKGSIGLIVGLSRRLPNYRKIKWAGKDRIWLYPVNELEVINEA